MPVSTTSSEGCRDISALKSDAYPADAEPGYGWEKLMGELGGEYYMEDYGLRLIVYDFTIFLDL